MATSGLTSPGGHKIRKPVGPTGPLGPYGALWGPMGPHGPPWRHHGQFCALFPGGEHHLMSCGHIGGISPLPPLGRLRALGPSPEPGPNRYSWRGLPKGPGPWARAQQVLPPRIAQGAQGPKGPTGRHFRGCPRGPGAQGAHGAPGRGLPKGPRGPRGPLGLVSVDTKHLGLGPKITKNQKIHEMGRRGSVWRETGAGFLVRPSRTSWDRSPGLPGIFFFTPLGPWAPGATAGECP